MEAALRASVNNAEMLSFPPLGGIDAISANTDFLESSSILSWMTKLYEEYPRGMWQ